MAQFWLAVLRRFPELIRDTATQVSNVMGVVSFWVAILITLLLTFNPEIAHKLDSADNFSRLWALIPFALILLYGFGNAIYEETNSRIETAIGDRTQSDVVRVGEARRKLELQAARCEALAPDSPGLLSAKRASAFCEEADALILSLLGENGLTEFHRISEIGSPVSEIPKMHSNLRKRLVRTQANALREIARNLRVSDLSDPAAD